MLSPDSFVQWVITAGVAVGALTPLTMSVVKFTELVGLSGKPQLAFAFLFGGLMGAFGYFALFGQPGDLLGWFQVFVFVLMNAGVPVGTYEAIKGAKAK
jgi:hypothetical protein